MPINFPAMSTRAPLLLTAFLTLVLIRGLCADAPAEPSSQVQVNTTAKGIEIKLVKNMPGMEILRLMGTPSTIETIKDPDVNAETWTYRRLVEQYDDQDSAAPVQDTTFSGFTTGQHSTGVNTRPLMLVAMRHTSVYQITVLLMVNDRFVVAKQHKERIVRYSN